HRQAHPPPVRLHLDSDDTPAAALRPADAFRLEGAAPGSDDQRRRDGDPGGSALDGSAFLDAQGLRRHLSADLPEADHAAVPRVQARGLSALPRASPLAQARERAREVRRLLALRRSVPRGLHPRRRRGEPRGEPGLRERALRPDLRDQHEPLHLLRLLRAGLPVRRHHTRQRVRDRRVLTRRPHLHEGHAPRRADQARPGRGPRPVRHPRAGLQDEKLMGNVLVWLVWFVAAAACLGTGVAGVAMTNPFFSALALIGNLASLAVLFLLLSAEFLAAAQVLVYAGAVMVMFLFVVAYLGGRADAPWAGGPRLLRGAAVVAAAALLVEIVVVLGLAWGDNLTDPAEISGTFGDPGQIGEAFLTDHLLAFEITSIVLLVAAVGGVVLGTTPEKEEEVA